MATISKTARFPTGGIGPVAVYTGFMDFGGISLNTGASITYTATIPNVGYINMDIMSISGQWDASNGFGTAFTNIAYILSGFQNAMGFNSCTTAQLDFDNIKVYDLDGNITSRKWFLVFGDGEVTEQGSEYLKWHTDGTPWINWTTVPVGTSSPYSKITGVGTDTIANDGTLVTGGSVHVSPIAITYEPQNIEFYVKTACTERTLMGLGIERVDVRKYVNYAYAAQGSILTYTIAVANVSLFDTLTNTTFIDTIPNGTQYINNSLTINNTTIASGTFPSLITLPDFGPQQVSTIAFNVLVTDGSVLSIPNTAYASGERAGAFDSMTSNIVSTTILNPNLEITKSVDKMLANKSDTITYTVLVKNNGNQTATSISLIDTVPATTSYVSGSLSGATGAPPNISVSNLSPGQIATISFKVLTNTNPSPQIINISYLSYSYIYDPLTASITIANAVSNSVITSTKAPIISSISKSVDKNYAYVNDTLTYSINFSNIGNDTAYTVTFSDTIPLNTVFVNDSMYLNGINLLGESPNPPGTIIPYMDANSINTITFQVIITTLPTTNVIDNQGKISYTPIYNTIPNLVLSNIVATSITYISVDIGKSVNSSIATIGDILVYTIPIQNNSNKSITNLNLIDTLPYGLVLVPNSIFVNGILNTGDIQSPGITIPNIGTGAVATVVFQVEVNTLPTINPVENIANLSYEYIFNPNSIPVVGRGLSQIAQTTIIAPNVSGINKIVDKVFVTINDTIQYTIVIPNTGNIPIYNCIFIDTIPSGTTFVSGSLTVDGSNTTYEPNSVPLGTINGGQVLTISYILRVN